MAFIAGRKRNGNNRCEQGKNQIFFTILLIYEGYRIVLSDGLFTAMRFSLPVCAGKNSYLFHGWGKFMFKEIWFTEISLKIEIFRKIC